MPKPTRSISPRMAHSRIFWGCSSPGTRRFLTGTKKYLKGVFRGTVLRQDVVSLRFVRPEVAIVETLTWISGFSASGPSPVASPPDAKGRLRIRLLQVMVKEAGDWKIAVDHNVDEKPEGVTAPEPQ
jgi:ketosteroid isomerase-like protein